MLRSQMQLGACDCGSEHRRLNRTREQHGAATTANTRFQGRIWKCQCPSSTRESLIQGHSNNNSFVFSKMGKRSASSVLADPANSMSIVNVKMKLRIVL